MIEILLWDICGAGLIVPRTTGVQFSNQVGGGACLQRTLEGIFIPINQDTKPGDYDSSLEARLVRVFKNVVEIGNAQADQIDALLNDSELTKGISVKRDRLSDSCEAWVHVDVKETPLSVFKNIGDFRAVLTWPNSD